MGKEIRTAIAGIGNCASSLVQGVYYYKNVSSNNEPVPGLMHNVLGGYKIGDIKFVAAFDIDKRKVGKDLSEAIFAKPNCTTVFQKDIPKMNVEVKKAPVLDGIAEHMKEFDENIRFAVDNKYKAVDIARELKKSKAEILLNYLPVGSEKAVKHLAQCCLDANVALINCMPVFIASNSEWESKFAEKNLPIIGDDVKSQVGATILHRALSKLLSERGAKIDRTYQLNVGGNTDFLNMLARERLKSKKISKSEAVQSSLPSRLEEENIHIGPSDFIPWLKDRKICFLRIEGRKFGNVPFEIETRLSVEDSPNSAGCMIDAIRCCKIALERKIGGNLTSISAYTMKHPLQQFPDNTARERVEEFIEGKRER